MSRKVMVPDHWAAGTWASLDAMTFPSGLPADAIADTLDPDSRVRATSPTNIGGALWCTVAAAELGLIDAEERTARLDRTLDALARLERHAPTGLLYNWYDPADGATLHTLPGGGPIAPFLSSVDNGWLAAALLVVAGAAPTLRGRAMAVFAGLDLGAFHDPDAVPGVPGGLLRGGAWPADAPADSVPGPHGLRFTAHHYGQLNSEPRIASYLGIAQGRIPAAHLQCLGRHELLGAGGVPALDPVGVRPGVGRDGCATTPTGRVVPTFGGSMFEALMPNLLVPETADSPAGWAVNHRGTVAAQRDFGLRSARFGSWGFSPASDPAGGYSEWGVAGLGVLGTGYPCDLERTPPGTGATTGWGDGVITPHALFLALPVAPEPAVDALLRLERDHGLVGPGGFDDAVALRSGLRPHRLLCLDQAMALAALANTARDDVLARLCCAGPPGEQIRSLVSSVRFAATEPRDPAGPGPTASASGPPRPPGSGPTPPRPPGPGSDPEEQDRP